MSEVLIILKREFMERVRTKSFLLSTFLFPALIIGIYTLPFLIGGDKGARTLVLVDEAPAGVAQVMAASLRTNMPEREGRTYTVEVMPGPLDRVQDGLRERVTDKKLDGYVHLPADVVATSVIQYRARNVSNLEVLGDVRRAASQSVQASRLRDAGLQATDLAALLRPVEVSSARVTTTGEETGNPFVTFLAAYIAAMLLWMMIMLYGVNVMRSVLEEKTNRIVEVLVSSMKASHLMLGKILGVGSVALLQVAIWGVLIALGVKALPAVLGSAGGAAGVLSSIKLTPALGAALLGYFVIGFFMYAAVFAAIGAAVTSEQEGQQFQTFAMLPLMLPVLFITKITADPMGPTATVLGMIPFTAPVANAIRLGTVELPAVQIVGSLVLMALTTAAVGWLAGKIYRFGILSTGKKASMAEIGRWLRAA
jgi:ABC-2 type transport system permease protein